MNKLLTFTLLASCTLAIDAAQKQSLQELQRASLLREEIYMADQQWKYNKRGFDYALDFNRQVQQAAAADKARKARDAKAEAELKANTAQASATPTTPEKQS